AKEKPVMSCCRPPSLNSLRRLLLALAAVAFLLSIVLVSQWLRADPDATLTDNQPWQGALPPGETQRITLAQADPERLYSVLIVLNQPAKLGDKDSVIVTVRDARRVLSETLLHSFD